MIISQAKKFVPNVRKSPRHAICSYNFYNPIKVQFELCRSRYFTLKSTELSGRNFPSPVPSFPFSFRRCFLREWRSLSFEWPFTFLRCMSVCFVGPFVRNFRASLLIISFYLCFLSLTSLLWYSRYD